jgi:hypothetical protein
MRLPFPFSLLAIGRSAADSASQGLSLDIFNCNDILSAAELKDMYTRQERQKN